MLNIEKKLEFVENWLLCYESYSAEELKEIKHKFSQFKSELKRRWTTAHKKEERFLKKNSDWLKGIFKILKVSSRAGRPTKTFQDLSKRSKRRRKTEDLHSNTDTEEQML